MRSRTIRVFALTLIFSLALMTSRALAESPMDVAQSTIEQVLRILKNPALKGQANRRQRLNEIKQVINQRFDYREMAKRCLAQHWVSLSEAQRDEFVRLFKNLLEASYADRFDKYENERVSYKGQSQNDGYAEVRIEIIMPNDRIPLTFRLLQEDSHWMIYDVIIEEVGLVSNYRSQFSRVIQESSYAGLVRRLQAKVTEEKEMKGL